MKLNYPKCQTSGKLQFTSRKLSEKISEFLFSKYEKTYSSYRCEHCRFWHLTTRKNLKIETEIETADELFKRLKYKYIDKYNERMKNGC